MKILNFLNKLYWHYIKSPEQEARHIGVQIGKDCLIATREWSSEPYLIMIGSNVQITSHVSFFTHGGCHCVRNKYPDFDTFGKIVIEDWAYIGSYSCILPGVIIGEGALIAAGSVVTKSVSPHTVVGGNPAKFICTTDEFYKHNKQFDIGTKNMLSEDKKRFLQSLPNEKFIQKKEISTNLH